MKARPRSERSRLDGVLEQPLDCGGEPFRLIGEHYSTPSRTGIPSTPLAVLTTGREVIEHLHPRASAVPEWHNGQVGREQVGRDGLRRPGERDVGIQRTRRGEARAQVP